MDEGGELAQTWRRLAKYLRKSSIPPWLRSELRGYATDAYDEQGFQTLCGQASLLLYVRRTRGRTARRTDRDGSASVTTFMEAREKKRAEVLGRELARLARVRGAAWREDGSPLVQSDVQRFRNRMFAGKPLSGAQANRFLTSPANAFFAQGVKPHLPYPLANHKATVTAIERINDPDGQMRRRYWLEITWPGGEAREPAEYSVDARRVTLHVSGQSRSQPSVYEVSVLGELATLANNLAEHYFWDPADATWFVLTDEPPTVHAFIARADHRGISDHTQWRMELTVQPWVSAKSLSRFYRHAQARLLGRENRNPRTDSLELLDVVAEARHRGASWKEAIRQWNVGRPRRQRYSAADVRNFRRDFLAIYQLVVRAPIRSVLSSSKHIRSKVRATKGAA